MRALQLHIHLEGSNPVIWRRIVLPETYTFYQLHFAIQAAFGWENVHLFQFEKRRSGENRKVIGIPYIESDMVIEDARKLPISQYLQNKSDKCLYVYDFGDYWEHMIVVEKTLNKDIYEAHCIDGENECPPEDVGGIHGYQQMIACFANGTRKAKKEYRDWLGISGDWDPGNFQLREVGKRMALVRNDPNQN